MQASAFPSIVYALSPGFYLMTPLRIRYPLTSLTAWFNAFQVFASYRQILRQSLRLLCNSFKNILYSLRYTWLVLECSRALHRIAGDLHISSSLTIVGLFTHTECFVVSSHLEEALSKYRIQRWNIIFT